MQKSNQKQYYKLFELNKRLRVESICCFCRLVKNCNIKKGMISIEDCKKILNKGKRKYTNDQIKMIRKYLYQFAEIELKIREENSISKLE